MIFPVTVYIRQGKFSVDVYEDVADIVKAAETEYNGNLLSDNALAYIETALIKYYAESDYEIFKDDGGLFLLFASCDTTNTEIGSEVKDLDESCDGSLLETIDLEEAIDFGEKGSVIEIDGKVVSACVENFPDEENECEVAVETAEEFRNRGYAKSCLAHMANKLTEQGRTLTYLCSADNKESVFTAQSAGLCEIGRDYYYIFTKKEN